MNQDLKKFTESEIDEILNWLFEDPTLTLELLKTKTKEKFENDVIISMKFNCLDSRCINLNLLYPVFKSIEAISTKQKRCEFASKK